MIEHVQLSGAIRVRQFQTPLDNATCLDAAQEEGTAKAILVEQRFDYAPVKREAALVGYVAERDLDANSGESLSTRMRPITPEIIVSGDALFHDLLRWLDGGFLFVLEGNQLTGFVTPSDANRQAARSYFYLLVAEVEVGLAQLIRERFGPGGGMELLSSGCRKGVERRLAADARQNLDADVVSYYMFSDLIKVVGKTEDIRLGLSRKQWDDCTGSLVTFRDWVMHPARAGVTAQYSIEQLRDYDERLVDLSERIRVRLSELARLSAT